MATSTIPAEFVEQSYSYTTNEIGANSYAYINLGVLEGYHPVAVSYNITQSNSPLIIISQPYRTGDNWATRIHNLETRTEFLPNTLSGTLNVLWRKDAAQ